MDDMKKTYREGEETAKEAWRKRDGEDMADKVGDAGDDMRRDLGNAGDELRRTDVDNPSSERDEPMTGSDTDLTAEDADRPI